VSTIDQIQTLRQILEKTEFQTEIHHLFIDFKTAYDKVNRNQLYARIRHTTEVSEIDASHDGGYYCQSQGEK
jgi:hypothetical protein